MVAGKALLGTIEYFYRCSVDYSGVSEGGIKYIIGINCKGVIENKNKLL